MSLSDKKECQNESHFHAKKCPDEYCENWCYEEDIRLAIEELHTWIRNGSNADLSAKAHFALAIERVFGKSFTNFNRKASK